MNTIITVLHVLAAFCLILTVLLQAGKGAAMGSGLGGGSSQTMFGSSGAGNFLTKLTTGIAILFMVTSLTLATFSNKKKSNSVIQGIEEPLPDDATESRDSGIAPPPDDAKARDSGIAPPPDDATEARDSGIAPLLDDAKARDSSDSSSN